MRLPFHPVQIDDFAYSLEPCASPGCLPNRFLLSHSSNLLPPQGQIQNQSARTIVFFLSHFHTDHMVGITAAWDGGYIYTTHTTRELLRQRFGDAFVDGVPTAAIEAYIRKLSSRQILSSNTKDRPVQQSVGPLHTMDYIRLRRAAQSGALTGGMAGVTRGTRVEVGLGMGSADLSLSSAPRMLFGDRVVDHSDPLLTPRVVPVEFEVKAWVSLSRGGPVHVGSSPPQHPLPSTLFTNRFRGHSSHCCDYLQFTFIPAHHIAGSAMIMFPQSRIGTCLYTGDFRYDPHTDEGRMMMESIRFWARREGSEGEIEGSGRNTTITQEDDGVENNDGKQSLAFREQQNGASIRALELEDCSSKVVVHDVCRGGEGPHSELQVVASNRKGGNLNSRVLTSAMGNEPPSGLANGSLSEESEPHQHRGGHGGLCGNTELAFSKESVGDKDDGEDSLLGEGEGNKEQDEGKECQEKNEDGSQDEWLLEALLASPEDTGSDGEEATATPFQEEQRGVRPAVGSAQHMVIDHLFLDDTWLHLTLSNNFSSSLRNNKEEQGKRAESTSGAGGGSSFDRVRSKLLSAAELFKAFRAVAKAVISNLSQDLASARRLRFGVASNGRLGEREPFDNHAYYEPHYNDNDLSSHSFLSRTKGTRKGGSFVDVYRNRPFIVRCYIRNNFGKEHLLMNFAKVLGTTVVVDDERYELARACCDPNSPDAEVDPAASQLDLRYFTPASRWEETVQRYFLLNRMGGEGSVAKEGADGFLDSLPFPPCCIEVVSQSGMISQTSLAKASRDEEEREYEPRMSGCDGACTGTCTFLNPHSADTLPTVPLLSACTEHADANSEHRHGDSRPNAKGEKKLASAPHVRAYGVIMSGWAKLRGRAARGTAEIFDIPYSLHTSPEHLVQFVASLRPRSVSQLQHGKGRGIARESAMMTRLGRHLATPFINAPIFPAEGERSMIEEMLRIGRRGHPQQLSARCGDTTVGGEGGGGKNGPTRISSVPCTLTPPAWVLARASVSNFPRGPAVRLRIHVPTKGKEGGEEQKSLTLFKPAEQETDSDETDDGGVRVVDSKNKRGGPEQSNGLVCRPQLSGNKRGRREEVHTILDGDDSDEDKVNERSGQPRTLGPRGAGQESVVQKYASFYDESKRIVELLDEMEELLGE